MVEIKGTHEEVDAVIALLQNSDCRGSDNIQCCNCPMNNSCMVVDNATIIYTD